MQVAGWCLRAWLPVVVLSGIDRIIQGEGLGLGSILCMLLPLLVEKRLSDALP
jgi:hypothetical protein